MLLHAAGGGNGGGGDSSHVGGRHLFVMHGKEMRDITSLTLILGQDPRAAQVWRLQTLRPPDGRRRRSPPGKGGPLASEGEPSLFGDFSAAATSRAAISATLKGPNGGGGAGAGANAAHVAQVATEARAPSKQKYSPSLHVSRV